MSISFNRIRTQVFLEDKLGSPLDDHDFKKYQLSKDDTHILKRLSAEDAKDFLYSGLLSITEGIAAIRYKRFSWATVKLYYSVYYLLRSRLAAHNIVIIWCNRIYRIHLEVGQKPNPGTRSISSTHAGTLMHYQEEFKETDKLLSNEVNGLPAYQWIKNVREITNYENSAFPDPEHLNIWEIFSSLSDTELIQAIESLQKDEYIKCFQEEYAIIGIPIKCLMQTFQEFTLQGILKPLSQTRIDHLSTIISTHFLELLLSGKIDIIH